MPKKSPLTKEVIGTYKGELNGQDFQIEFFDDPNNDDVLLSIFYWTDKVAQIKKQASKYVKNSSSFDEAFCISHYSHIPVIDSDNIYSNFLVEDWPAFVFSKLWINSFDRNIGLVTFFRDNSLFYSYGGYVGYSYFDAPTYGEMLALDFNLKQGQLTAVQLLETGYIKYSFLRHFSFIGPPLIPIEKLEHPSRTLKDSVLDYYEEYRNQRERIKRNPDSTVCRSL